MRERTTQKPLRKGLNILKVAKSQVKISLIKNYQVKLIPTTLLKLILTTLT
jgi:hypothetical protein